LQSNNPQESEEDDESEAAAINPMVSGFADDLDFNDFKPIDSTSNSHHVEDISDEEIAIPNLDSLKISHGEPKTTQPKAAKALFDVPPNLSLHLEEKSIDGASFSADSEIEEKKKKPKKKKSKKRASKSPSRERDELEDFLNGSLEGKKPPDATVYEELWTSKKLSSIIHWYIVKPWGFLLYQKTSGHILTHNY